MKNFFFSTKAIILNIALMISVFYSVNLIAQVNVGGKPMSSLIQLDNNFQTVTLPEIDSKKLLEEDAAVANIPDLPLRYAKLIDVNFNLNNSGTWENLSDGSRIWRLAINSNDAFSINLNYTDFHLPGGATLFVYNSDKSMVLGAFTELNNTSDGQFATALTNGPVMVVEYYEPVYSAGLGRFNISKVVHAYKDIYGFSNALELACNININCPIGAPWVNQKRSIARMTFNQGGSGFLCSGSLVNNTLGNRTPYFLTADHCESDNWSTLVVNFNYESPTCNGTNPGTFQSMTGASVKSTNFATDFRLLQLNSSVPASVNAYYNGWDKSGAQPLNQTAIHHPGGAIKKISYDENPASNSNGFGGRLPGGFWQVTWDQGVTEGGSSGCPMYDQNKRVIGQNLGGIPAQCENPQSVYKVFGKFSESWAYGGSSANQLKDWLDPNNSGVTTLDGIDDITGVAPASNFTSNIQTLPVGGGNVDFYDLTTNAPASWSWSFPGGTPSTSTAQNPTGISYSATGFYTVALTTTNSFGSNLKTIVNYVKVVGVPMNVFNLQSPPANFTVTVSQNDPSIFQFKWGTANPSPTVKYSFRIKKAGPSAEMFYNSDNNGIDSVISFRRSFLDSMAVTMGLTGDSVTCIWRVSAANGADTLTTAPAVVKIRRMTIGINQLSSSVPEKFNLYNNYPNPFNPKTIIKFDIAKTQFVKLVVFNLLGEQVSTLVNQNLTPGSYSIDFDGSSLSSGMYLYRIESQGFVQTKRMVLVK